MGRLGLAARAAGAVVVAVVVVASFLVAPTPAAAATFGIRYQTNPLPGVDVWGLRDASLPLSVDVGRVAADAGVHLEVVRAGEAVAGDPGRLETASAACRRVGGIICVNGDFSECATCGAPRGGVVHDGVLERTGRPDHPQLRRSPSEIGAGPLGLSASLLATTTYAVPDGRERVVQASLPLDAINRSRSPGQVVLFTPRWRGSIGTTAGGDEAVLVGGQPALGADVPVGLRELRPGAGSTPVPADGMVVSAEGAGATRMRAFWAVAADPAAVRHSLVLQPRSDRPVEESVGGHPVLLAADRDLVAGSTDPFATSRHPRTMVGWNPAGDLWLVTVDGRQPGHSVGASLTEGAAILRQLGATDGFNLDGGGSTTFVSLPPGGGRTPTVLNRPSDGTERRIATFLAVVPNDPVAVRCGGVGTPRVGAAAARADASQAASAGYRMVASDGGVFAFGDAGFFGAVGGSCLGSTIVGTSPTPSGGGYWIVGSDGGVFAFGDAGFFGSAGGQPLNRPVVGMAPTPSGGGYWLVASDGGVFAFGDAGFLGSTGGVPLNRAVVGMAATPSGGGYWLVASDGGIFAFGDAAFLGSTGGVPLNAPVVGMTARATGSGYWLVASDGGIFAFGDAPFLGSTGGVRLNQPMVGMSRGR